MNGFLKKQVDKKLKSSPLFFLFSACGFTAGALDSDWQANRTLLSHCFDMGPASPLLAALLQADLHPFQSLSASAGLQSRLWPSRLNGMHGELWHYSCVEVIVAGRSLRWLGRTCVFVADYWGVRPGPPLHFASFSFNFSSPPWVFGIHDCMFYADLTAIMSTFQSFCS